MILIDTQDRRKLREGRDREIGFAFAKKTDGTLTLLQPISACKDYLNDVVYTEHTGIPFAGYGIVTSRVSAFTDRAYLVMAILTAGAQTQIPYPNYERDAARLESSFLGMQKFINHFEAILKLEPTVITKLEPNRFCVDLPAFWVRYPYLISSYSLVLRNGLWWDGVKDPMAHLKWLSNEDYYMMGNFLPKWKRILAGELPVQDMTEHYDIHNTGIIGMIFPSKP